MNCLYYTYSIDIRHCTIFNTGFYFLPSCRCFLSRVHVFTVGHGGGGGGGERGGERGERRQNV